MTISSLRRRMGCELALRKLSALGLGGILRRWLRGPVRGIAEIYIPYRLYKLTLRDRRLKMIRYYALDAATGTLDPYEFTAPPEPDELIELEPANVHPVRLDEALTRKMATEKVRRLLYSRGFFRLMNPSISAELLKSEFYIPYWAGFSGDQHNVSTTVIDAVRQRVEGSKASRLVETWLLESQGDNGLALTGAHLVKDSCRISSSDSLR